MYTLDHMYHSNIITILPTCAITISRRSCPTWRYHLVSHYGQKYKPPMDHAGYTSIRPLAFFQKKIRSRNPTKTEWVILVYPA